MHFAEFIIDVLGEGVASFLTPDVKNKNKFVRIISILIVALIVLFFTALIAAAVFDALPKE